MNKFICFLILLAFGASASNIWADRIAPNKTFICYSSNGNYMIEMIPSSAFGSEGEGRVYTVVDSAKGEFLWKVDWYDDVALMNDGEHLVRFGPWASDKKNLTDLAIAFYHKDILLKEYHVNELMKDKTTISESVSHYSWEANSSSISKGFSPDSSTYTIITSDKNAYIFDVFTGTIKETFLDSSAQNHQDIFNKKEYK